MSQNAGEPRARSDRTGFRAALESVRGLGVRLSDRTGLPIGLIVGLLVLASVAYGRLLLWDPGRPGLPDTTWFFFGWSDTTPQIVFAIAAVLLYRLRHRLARTCPGEGRTGVALPFLALGLTLHLWGVHSQAPDLMLASLVPMSIGAGALLFGPDFCRPLILPLLVLTFAIPLPGVLANHLLYPLELRDAKDVEWMLHTLGIPALREGTGLYLSGRTFAVIEACSGLRSIQVLTLLAVAWSSFFAVRLPHALVLILAAPLIAYGVNLLRILSLVLTPYPDVVSMHTAQGVLVFLAGLVVLYGVDDLLRRVWPVPEESPTPQASPRLEPGHDRERTRRGLALAGLLLMMVGAPFTLGPWRVDAPDQSSPIRLAKQLNGFEARQSTRESPRLLGSVALARSIDREYERDGEVVRVFVGWDDRSRRDRSLLSPLHALPGPEWEPEERTRLPAEAGHPSIEAILARSSSQRVLSYWWSSGRGGLPQEVLRASLATDQSFLRRPGGALVVRLSVDLQTVGDDRERGHELLREFLGLLRTSLVAPGS